MGGQCVQDQRLQRLGLRLGQAPPRGAGHAAPKQLAADDLQSCGHLQNLRADDEAEFKWGCRRFANIKHRVVHTYIKDQRVRSVLF